MSKSNTCTLSLFRNANTPAATSDPKIISRQAKNCGENNQQMMMIFVRGNMILKLPSVYLYSLNPEGIEIPSQLHNSRRNRQAL